MLKEKKIGVIGTGNMGEALISGLLHSRSSTPENIICSDIRKDKLKYSKGVIWGTHKWKQSQCG